MVRRRANPGDIEKLLLDTAAQDSKRVRIGFGKDPGQAEKTQAFHLVRALSGFTVAPAAESGDKLTRFGPFNSQCRAGNVKIRRGTWNEESWAGIVMSPGGFVMMIMMFIVGPLTAKVQPKYLIVIGAMVTALSMFLRALADAAQPWIAGGFPADHNRVLRRRSVRQDRPGLRPSQRGEKYRRLARHFSSLQCPGASRAVSSEPPHRPGDPAERSISGHASSGEKLFRRPGHRPGRRIGRPFTWIGKQVQAQVSFLAYMDAFWVLMLLTLAAVPLALTLRKVKLGIAAPAAH